MKIIVTGNKGWGVAEAISKYLSSEYKVFCASRQSWHDLSTESGVQDFTAKSFEYDAFINCAKLKNFQQTLLLKAVWDSWKEREKTGHIINIGSTVDTGLKGGSRLYTTEKVALRNLSRKLTYDAMGGSGIRVSYISFGYLNTKNVSFKDKVKVDLGDVVNVIKWVLESPSYININEISIDPIQVENNG
jgi:NAD(P)-dependent dehydrogenase (short-subunit alcohol dehydrogenase family)